MARVTVEDCLDKVDNRFELVLIATKRARQLALGAEPLVEWDNDKPTVVALREIAEGQVTKAILDEPLVSAEMEFAGLDSGGEFDVTPPAAAEPDADSSTQTSPES